MHGLHLIAFPSNMMKCMQGMRFHTPQSKPQMPHGASKALASKAVQGLVCTKQSAIAACPGLDNI